MLLNGRSVARLSVATSESWKDKNTGERKEKTKELIANHKMQCRECGGNETAKINSLITVDEIISTFVIMGLGSKFYEDVKTEIEKL